MLFQALTDAPILRGGARLNVMAVPQPDGRPVERLAAGARVTLRLGHCCPLVCEGHIRSADCDRAVLTLDGAAWMLEHRPTGVSVPGIVSEDWVVLAQAA